MEDQRFDWENGTENSSDSDRSAAPYRSAARRSSAQRSGSGNTASRRAAGEVRARSAAASGARKRRKKKKKKRTALIVVLVIAAVLLVLGVTGVIYFNHLRSNTASFFGNSPVPAATAVPTATAATAAAGSEAATPEAAATPDASGKGTLESAADLSLLSGQNILNIALIGVDYAEERESTNEGWDGKDGLTSSHADVIIVLAINFTNQTVDMISLPRDTYAQVPGVTGIYKINSALDCGGGLFLHDADGNWIKDARGNYTANAAGLEKVCAAAQWMIGDVPELPVQYYYCVTMPAVKGLVDAVGGVDYDLETDFTMQGREYKAGQQHMNGQAVLDYLRVRKAASGLVEEDTGDEARVNRQKDMLVAIFNQLKSGGMLSKIPSILDTFDGQLFTNCTLEQTAALALYAYDMPAANIRMHTMDGDRLSGEKKVAGLNFLFTDEEARVALIKEVYGVDVPQHLEYTRAYAAYFWWNLVAERYLSAAHGLKDYLEENGLTGYSEFDSAYSELRSAKSAAVKTAEKYLVGDSNFLASAAERVRTAAEAIVPIAQAAKSDSGYSRSLAFSNVLKRYNEIEVDPS